MLTVGWELLGGFWGHLSAPAAGLGDPKAELLLLALPMRSDRMQTSLKWSASNYRAPAGSPF